MVKIFKIVCFCVVLVGLFLFGQKSQRSMKSENAMKEEIYKDAPAENLREGDVWGVWGMLVPNAKYKDWTDVSMVIYFTFEKDNVVEYYPNYKGVDAKGKKVSEDVPNVFGPSIYLLIHTEQDGDLLKVGIFSNEGKDLNYLYFRKKEDQYFLGCNIEKHICSNTLSLNRIGDLPKEK